MPEATSLPSSHTTESPNKRNSPPTCWPPPSQQHRKFWIPTPHGGEAKGESSAIHSHCSAMAVLHMRDIPKSDSWISEAACTLIHQCSCDGKLPQRQLRCSVHADKCIPILNHRDFIMSSGYNGTPVAHVCSTTQAAGAQRCRQHKRCGEERHGKK